MSRESLVCVVCLLVVCLTGVVPVQAQTQTGNITGTVRDPNGEAMPGVTVTVSGPSVMGTRADVTNDAGMFRIHSLLPGDDYVVNFVLEGFASVVREGIRVSVGQTTTLMISLELSAVADEIVVSGKTPVIDITSPTASNTFDAALLSNVPNSRAWADAVVQSPGVVSEIGGGRASARGGSVMNNSFAYDGVKSTSPIYNFQPAGMVFEAVEEVQIVSGALPAELGDLGGAFINVVTKSGGNQFRGDVAAYYESDSLQSDNVTSDLREVGIESSPAITDYVDYSFNLGGPIVKDKVWFNLAYWNRDSANEVNGFPYDYDVSSDYYFGKVTWQPATNHSIVAMYNTTESNVPYISPNQFVAPEACWNGDNDDEISKLKWTPILSDSLFMEVDLSRTVTIGRLLPQADSGARTQDIGTGMTFGGTIHNQIQDSTRSVARATLSWFKDDWGGSHAFKTGLEYNLDEMVWDTWDNTDVYLQLAFLGYPLYAMVVNNPNHSLYEMEGLNFFVQDSWSVSDRVTLNLGVRLNNWEGSYPPQAYEGKVYGTAVFEPVVIDKTVTVFDWSTWEPRLAATIALDDQGKSALRVGLSRYHHAPFMASFMPSNPQGFSYSYHFWVDLDGDLYADADELLPPILSAYASGKIASDLSPSYTNEATIEYERELFTDFSIKINATYRKDEDLIEDVNFDISDGSFLPTQVPDPGPDGVPGTADDQVLTLYNQIADFDSELTVANPDGAFREYKGVELIATKRMSGKWQALASLVWQNANGNVGNSWDESTTWTSGWNDPNSNINIEGPPALEREWQLKLIGTYLGPWGLAFSGYYQYQTGTPLVRTYGVDGFYQGAISVVADPKDRHRNDDYSKLDLRVEKTFALGARPWELGLIVDVFNVLNENGVTGKYSNTGTYNATTGVYTPGPYPFGNPTDIQAPRIARLGARLRF